MQTSTLRYPKADRFIRIHESLMAACNNNACAAALIVFFEGWHNYKLRQRAYTELYNRMSEDARLPTGIDVGGWQYHTNEQLEAGVMIYRIDTINKALKQLEEQGFISTEVPERYQMLLKTGRTRWFLLRADVINEWFDSYERKLRPIVARPIVARKDKSEPEEPKPGTEAMQIFYYWSKRTGQLRAVPNAERLALIRARLREGFTMVELCRAVEGVANSEWHMGKNDRKRAFNDITLIFRNATKVESFIRLAHEAGITMEQVRARLEGDDAVIPVEKPKTYDASTKANILELVIALIVHPEQTLPLRQLRAMRLRPSTLREWRQELIDRVEGQYGAWSETYSDAWNDLLESL